MIQGITSGASVNRTVTADPDGFGTMTSEHSTGDKGRTRILRELHELIAALDRRVPQVERAGEITIARAAAALKEEALKRIATLERESDADAIASWSEPIQKPASLRPVTAGDSDGAE